jgi:ornithine decarboxylase
VKANNDPRLLSWLAGAHIQFDCASVREMHDVIAAGAAPHTDIVYAHPCKTVGDLRKAAALGVPNTVVDSPEEVEKLAAAEWPGGVLIRLLVPDAGSAQPFSKKFGAPLDWVPDIRRALDAAGLKHSGWSFHVGSVCGDPAQYRKAIEMCAMGADMTGAAEIVDIGGGFVPDPATFRAAAAAIRKARRLFPSETRWISEPGRFFAAPAADAEIEVIGVKQRVGDPQSLTGIRVTVDESVYGIFSNIPFDGAKPAFRLLARDAAMRIQVPTTIFGRACDSADCLVENALMPTLRVGDRLRVPAMGAYTVVSASDFNGFPQPLRLYDERGSEEIRQLR